MHHVPHLLCFDPSTSDQYILRMPAPITLLALRDMSKNDPVTDTRVATKTYERILPNGVTQVVQLAGMPINDGISDFLLTTVAQLEWIMDEAWKWYCDKVEVEYESQ